MKKLLLVAVLAAVVLGMLAAPALAGRKVQTVRPPTDVPILFAQQFDVGVWFWNTGATDNAWNDVSGYLASDVLDPANGESPIPVNTDVVAISGWVGATYGQVKNLPKYLDTSIDITETTGGTWSQHFTPAEVAPYWTGPHRWDLWWSQFYGDPVTGELGTPPLPFNPKIGAGVYLNHLFLPIGPFPNVGWYHFECSQLQVRPFTDLILYDPSWPHPANFKPGPDSLANSEYEFDFYVGP